MNRVLLLSFLFFAGIAAQAQSTIHVHTQKEENGKIVEYDTTITLDGLGSFQMPGNNGGLQFNFGDGGMGSMKSMPMPGDMAGMQRYMDSLMQSMQQNFGNAFSNPYSNPYMPAPVDTSLNTTIGHSVMMYDEPNTSDGKVNAHPLKTKSLDFYPDVEAGNYTLSFDIDPDPATVVLTDVTGEQVYTEQLGKKFNGHYEHLVQLGPTAEGVYYVELKQNGKSIRKKLMIR